MADDLMAFLRARLDEDETTARAAGGDRACGDWRVSVDHPLWNAIRDTNGEVVVYDEGSPSPEEAVHIARHDPARALREVAAKRAILDEHAAGARQETCCICHAGGWDWEPEKWPCPTARALAAVYSGHPDYRAEWKPAGGSTVHAPSAAGLSRPAAGETEC